MTDKYGLYVHIPFCVRKCLYCDFVSVSADDAYVEKYFNALKNELEKCNINSSCKVDTIYIGGGTPSSVSPHFIKELFEIIYSKFNVMKDGEITIEINPGTVSREKIQTYRECGINRVSIGAQSLCDKELKKLGRIHTAGDFYECFNLVKDAGFDNINVDLMSAVPGQSLIDYRNNLEKIIELKPRHISAYSLIIEENTPFYDIYEGKDSKDINPEYRLADEDEERKMYKMTGELLKNNGYIRYEISNYCIPGFESRHNSGYWKGKNYLGFGAAAASLNNGRRYKNTSDIDKYIASYPIEKEEDYVLSQNDKIEEFMFLGLRMIKGVSITEFRERFNKDIMDVYKNEIDRNMERGLLEVNYDYICLTEKGLDLSNLVFSEFLL